MILEKTLAKRKTTTMSKKPTLQEAAVLSLTLERLIDQIRENGSSELLKKDEIDQIVQLSKKLTYELGWAVFNDRARRSDES